MFTIKTFDIIHILEKKKFMEYLICTDEEKQVYKVYYDRYKQTFTVEDIDRIVGKAFLVEAIHIEDDTFDINVEGKILSLPFYFIDKTGFRNCYPMNSKWVLVVKRYSKENSLIVEEFKYLDDAKKYLTTHEVDLSLTKLYQVYDEYNIGIEVSPK